MDGDEGRDVAAVLVRGTGIKLGANLGIKFLGVVFYILLLRFLSPEEAGNFLIATAVLGIAATFSSLGLSVAPYRFVPLYLGKGEKERARPFIMLLLRAILAISFAVSLAIFFFADQIAAYYGKPIADLLQVTAICSFLTINGAYMVSVLDSLKRFIDGAACLVVQSLGKVLFLLFAVYALQERTAYAAMLAFLGGLAISFVVLSWLFLRQVRRLPENGKAPRKGELAEAVKFSFPVYLSSTAESTAAWVDSLVLGFFWPSPVVAAYASVMVLARNISPLVASAVTNVQQTLLSEHHSRKSRYFAPIVKMGVKWTVYLGMPVLCAFLAFPSQVLAVMFPQYVSSAYLFYIIAPAFYLILLSNSSRNALFSSGRSDLLLRVALVLVFLNAALNVAFVPGFGMDGAAAATLISIVIGELLAIHYASHHTESPMGLRGMLGYVWKGTAACLVAAAASSVLLGGFAGGGLVQLGIAIAAMCLAYGILLVVFRAISQEEWEIAALAVRALPFGELPASAIQRLFAGKRGAMDGK